MRNRIAVLQLLLFLTMGFHSADAAEPALPTSELYKEIENLDRKLFDAFNACDTASMREPEIIPGSIEICAPKEYGALQIARHNFFIMEDGKKGKLAASPK